MGREATCACRWGSRTADVKIHLDARELTVRGSINLRIARAEIDRIAVRDGSLALRFGGDEMLLALGDAGARKWAAALVAPAPTLAKKLGIADTTRLNLTGEVDDDALAAAIAVAGDRVPLGKADLALLRADDLAQLTAWLRRLTRLSAPPPAWVVAVKGRSATLPEGVVRDALRGAGFVDTKVASVSDRLSAVRYIKRST